MVKKAMNKESLLENKFDIIADIVVGRLGYMEATVDPDSLDDNGWWILGHTYLFLYNSVKGGYIPKGYTPEAHSEMHELLIKTSGPAAQTYKAYRERSDELDEEEEGFFTLLFAWLYLYKEYLAEQKKRMN